MPQGYVFDAYGTLFDVASVGRALRDLTADPEALSALWRRKQLEYTWLGALMGRWRDFRAVTEAALRHALRVQGLAPGDERVADLVAAYDALPAFPEVPAALDRLRRKPLAILSNGTAGMLASAVRSSGLEGRFAHVLSVDAVRTYKPSPAAYALAPLSLGVNAGDLLFVSSNAWDVAGAKSFGYRVAWVNRTGAAHEDLGYPPDEIVDRLDRLG